MLFATAFNENWFSTSIDQCTGIVTVDFAIYNDEPGTTNDDFWEDGAKLQIQIDGVWSDLGTIKEGGGGPWSWNPNDDGYISFVPGTFRTLSSLGSHSNGSSGSDVQFLIIIGVALKDSDIGKTMKFRISGTWEDGGNSGEETLTYNRTPDATSCTASDATDCNQTNISWTLPSGICANAMAEIHRNGNFLKEVNAASLSTSDVATPGVTYQYKVRFYMQMSGYKNYGGFSPEDGGTRKNVPGSPINFIASDDRCDGSVLLSWEWNDISPLNFRIYRDGIPLPELGGNLRSYEDKNRTRGIEYSYTIQARNDCGWGPQSSAVIGISPLGPEKPVDLNAEIIPGIGVRLSWPPVSRVNAFRIERSQVGGSGASYFDVHPDSLSFLDESLIQCQTYEYRLRAYNECSTNGVLCDSVPKIKLVPELSDVFDPATSLLASKGYFSNRVELNWTIQNNANFINAFKIYRKPYGSNQDSTIIGTLNSGSHFFIDPYTDAGVLYQYTIVAESQCEQTTLYSNVASSIGFRSPFGTVTGNVSYGGGIAVQGVRITAESTSGIFGNSLLLDGTQHLRVMDAASLDVSNGLLLETWIKPVLYNADFTLIEKAGSYSLRYIQISNEYRFTVYKSATEYAIIAIPASNLLINNYSHIAAQIYNDSLQIYVNGIKKISESALGVFLNGVDVLDNSSDVLIGQEFAGHLDELRIWNGGKSEEQMRNDFSRIMAGGETGLRVYIRMNEGVGNFAYDISKTGLLFNRNHAGFVGNLIWSDVIPTSSQLGAAAYTDALGNYVLTVPYNNAGEVFICTPDYLTHEFNPSTRALYIGDGAGVHVGIDFLDKSSFTVSGSVNFKNTTCGVKDAFIKVDGELILVQGVPAKTDGAGLFQVQVPIGNHVLTVEQDGHVYSVGRFPATGSYDFQEPLAGINFIDSTLIKVVGRVVGGTREGNKIPGLGKSKNNIGQAEIILTSLQGNGCSTHEITTVDTSGEFIVFVPPLKYNPMVDILHNPTINFGVLNQLDYSGTPELQTEYDTIFNSSGGIVHIDSIQYHHKLDYIYRVLPQIAVFDKDGVSPFIGDSVYRFAIPSTGNLISRNLRTEPLRWPVFHQQDDDFLYRCMIRVFELYSNLDNGVVMDSVPTTDGKLHFNNELALESYLPNTPAITVELKDFNDPDTLRSLVYSFKPGYPNFIPNASIPDYSFTRKLEINLITSSGQAIPWLPVSGINIPFGGDGVYRAYMLGKQSKGTQFVTEGPQVPEYILRDPPGSNSSASWEVGVTKSEQTKWSWSLGSELYSIDELAVGTKVITGVGVATPSETINDQSAGFHTTFGGGYTGSQTVSKTTTKTVSTSDDTVYPTGADSDVYIGTSKNVEFGIAEELIIMPNTQTDIEPLGAADAAGVGSNLTFGKKYGLSVVPGGYETHFKYTEYNIKYLIIPNLIHLRNVILQSNPKYTWSLPIGDENYGKNNDDPVFGDNVSTPTPNSGEFEDLTGPSYIYSATTLQDSLTGDSVRLINYQISKWEEAIRLNEWEKVNAGNPSAIDSLKNAELAKLEDDNSGVIADYYALVVITGIANTVTTISTLVTPIPGAASFGYLLFGVTTANSIHLAEVKDKYEAYLAKRQRIEDKFSNARTPENYTLGGGVSIEESMTHESASTFEREIEFGLQAEFVKELGAKVSGTGFGFEKGINLTFSSGRNWSEDSEETETVSYSLDINAGDLISVDVYPSMLGWGPIFKTKAGSATSCPYEPAVVTSYYEPIGTVISPATLQIEKPTISSSQSILTNIPSDQPAVFNVTLGNESALNYTEAYNLKMISASNPFGAIVRFDGLPFQQVEIPGGTSINKVITIEKGAGPVYNYDSILVVFTSQCQYAAGSGWTTDIGDSIYISAHFIPTCTKVSLATPEDKWVLNNSFHDTMPVALVDYNINLPDLEFLRVDYKPTDKSDWIGLQTFLKDTSGLNDPDLVPIPSTTSFTLYDWDVSQLPDGDYDLRVVSQCTFAEKSSVSHTGIIDRVNPHLFGNPSPADGILSPNDEISIKFNEAIYAGAINPTFNFDIRGVTNGTEVKHSTSLFFDGINDYVEVTGGVPLARRDFTIEFSAMRIGSGEQAIISQGTDANECIFIGFNAANRFVFRINDHEVVSASSIAANVWTYFAVSYDYELERAEIFIADGNSIAYMANVGNTTIYPDYVGSGALAIGKNTVNNSNYFSGNFHELRIWNAARTLSQFSLFKSTLLSGSELGLLYNWRMDEADGIIAEEHIRRRDATIFGAQWQVNPNGNAAAFDGVNDYLKIYTGDVNITEGMDFTMEFWFNSTQPGIATLFSNGTSSSISPDSLLSWNIDKDDEGLLFVRHNGNSFQATSQNFFDGQWHHFALVFQRTGNMTSFVDGNLQNSTQALPYRQLGSSHMYLGARGYVLEGNESITQFYAGKMDEFRFWNTARKLEQVRRDKQNRMTGDELGLELYLPFEDFQTDPSGIPILTPGFNEQINSVIHTVNAANGVSLVSLTPKIKLQRPVQAINFSYSLNNDQIILTPVTSAEIIENVTLDITVQGLKDLHGNVMESPVTWIAYVDKNQVVWQEDVVNYSMIKGETLSFKTQIVNKGGATKQFNLLDIPDWLTAEPSSGTINPNSSLEITFTVNADINIGKYTNDISLLTDFNFPERLTINLKVSATEPDWSVNPAQFENFMGIIARLKINGVVSTDAEDMIVAYVGQQVRGVAHLEYVPQLDIYLAFLDVYSNLASGEAIEFRIWDASSGTIFSDVLPANITFTSNAVLGSVTAPQVFSTGNKISLVIDLHPGWNWLGWPIQQEDPLNVNQILSSFAHTNGDQIKALTAVGNYNGQSNQWNGTLGNTGYGIKPEWLYKLYTALPGTLIQKGTVVNPTTRPITLVNNWNWIGFISIRNMSVTQALGNLNATHGDVIKSKTQFATYDGTLHAWIGSLKVMKPGEGYMYKSTGTKTFTYPIAGMFNNTLTGGNDPGASNAVSNPDFSMLMESKWKVQHEIFNTNMTIMGTIHSTCGESLVQDQFAIGVFDLAGNVRGMSAIETQEGNEVIYLTLSGIEGDQLSVHLLNLKEESETDLDHRIIYSTNSHIGALENLYTIDISEAVCHRIANDDDDVQEAQYTAFPTLFTQNFHIRYLSQTEDNDAFIRMYDRSGHIVYTQKVSCSKGWNLEQVGVDHLNFPAGLYTVELNSNQRKESLSVIKGF